MTDKETIEALRKKGHQVQDAVETRPKNGGSKVFRIDGQDIDEMFVHELLNGVSFEEIQLRRNRWLASLP